LEGNAIFNRVILYHSSLLDISLVIQWAGPNDEVGVDFHSRSLSMAHSTMRRSVSD